jgi:hypothetical protein
MLTTSGKHNGCCRNGVMRPILLSHESYKRSTRLLKRFTASKQKRYLTRHSLTSFMVSPTCSFSVYKVKMDIEGPETFLYMSDRPPTAFRRWPDLKVELKKRILAYLLDAEIMHTDIPEVNWRTGPVISNNNVYS